MVDTKYTLEPIAIIGIGCRFPGSEDVKTFWDNLKSGVDSIKDIPEDRWNKDEFYSEENGQIGKMNTKRGGFLERVDLFDADFFNISAEEADSMDPQQRLLLELSYEALEDSGQKIKSLKGERVGVFVGISSSDYAQTFIHSPEQMNMYSISGSAGSVASNRLSYYFDFKGPSVSIDTACSSSLVALHLACQSIRLKESKMAIVGGANIILSPYITIGFSQAQATSPDGICRAFDSLANGMVRGEGGGVVVLKPLSEAIKDNDKIYVVIKGSAINQDGQTNGLLAPSTEGQKEVLKNALEYSNVNPEDIDYIEAHGTGTILGDPIEAKALGEVLNVNRNKICKIGAVKTNIGHLEAAAGIAGLIKTALCLKNRFLVPTLNYKKSNPYIDFDKNNLKVQTELEKFPEEKIIAGVSSFGFGGTNAHVILESYQNQLNEDDGQNEFKNYLLPITANSLESVKDYCHSLVNLLENENSESTSIKDLAYSLSLKKDFYNFRTSLVADSKDNLINQLKNIDDEDIFSLSRKKPKICFVFSGMGSQQPGMGKDLLNEPVFYQVIENCDKLMEKYLDWSLLDEIKNSDKETQQQIERVQPTLFALQIALVELWKSYGINPDLVLGSSVGEVAAAYISGSITLEDAVKIICLRNVSMIKMIGKGAMAIVQLSENETNKFIENSENIWVSALNSPSMTVLSGKEDELEKITKRLKEADIFCRMIKGAVAPSHCDLMEPVREEIIDNLVDVKPQKESIEIYSTVTTKKQDGNNFDAQYWWQNVKSPIRFVDTIKEIEKTGNYIYLEISPHPVLVSFIKEILALNKTKSIALAALRKDNPNQFLESLGNLFSLGIDINWQKLYGEKYNALTLPSYAWQRKYHWFKEIKSDAKNSRVFNRIKQSIPENTNDKVVLTREVLENSPLEKRKSLLNNYLRSHVARVLKVSESDIEVKQPLKNLGIGSLMGMELFNRLKSDLEISLSISKFLKGPSIDEISDEIINNLANNSKIINIPILENREFIPLSFSQQRLWFIEKFEPDIFAYNIPAGLKLEGKIDLKILEKSINEIVKRHEILRTNFKTKNGQPYQYIHLEKYITVKEYNLDLADVKDEVIEQIILKETSEKFDLELDNLLRLAVIKMSDNQSIVVLTIHHIIADGLSLKVIFSELINFYQSFVNNQIPSLAVLPVQYIDYSVWQTKQFENKVYYKQVDYWTNKLADIPSLLKLPTDRPRPEVQSYKGAAQNFILPEDLYKKLTDLSKSEGVTLFVILLSAFKLLLSSYSGQTDIIVGTPVAGRNEPELENMVGLFLNMLAIRDEINNELKFSELLKNVSKTTLEAYDNQDLPFEKIVETLKPDRRLNTNPIFQVIMALHASIEIESFGDIKIESIDIDMKTAKFDLILSFIPDNQGFKGVFEYNKDIFDDLTIENIKSNYLFILETITQNRDIKLNEINLLSAMDEKNIIENFSQGNKTKLEEFTVIDLFRNQVYKNPELIAVSDKNNTLTYKQLDEKSDILANNLIKLKNEKDIPISILLEKSTNFIIAILGILKSNNFYLPLDINYPQDRNNLIISESQTKILISSKNLNSKVIDGDFEIIYIEENLESNLDEKNIIEENSYNDLAYLIYTSGTTGTPKGVEVTHKNLANLVNWHKKYLDSQISENKQINTSLLAGSAFDASVWEVWGALANGLSIYIPEKEITESANKLVNWFNQKQINIAFVPTPLLELILDKDWSDNKYLKTVLTGGDKLNKRPKNNVPFKLYNHYGPTECTVVASSGLVEYQNKENLADIPSIGKPIDNTEIYILDQQLKLNPINVIGEIYIGGEGVAKGYCKNNSLTNQFFINTKFGRLYKTGDRGRFLNNGNIEFLGRNDNQIKIRGVRIELAEVEKTIANYPNVKNVAVSIIEENNIKKLIAYVIAENNSGLESYLKKKLPEAMLPKIIYINSFPINANGKIDFKQLNINNLESGKNTFKEDKTSIQDDLVSIWEEVLKVENISINDNFFDLGGHSLIAIELIDRINEKYDLDISLKELFNSANIKDISEIIQNKKSENINSFVLPKIKYDAQNISKPFPLTDLQQAYWVGRGNNFNSDNVSSHAYVELDTKDLDISKFEKAINKVIKRHHSLRTIILKDGTQQVLEDYPQYKIKVNDLRNTNPDLELEKIRSVMSHEILDTEKFPLFNISISLINQNLSRIHLSIDGLIADATSMMILANEISLFYKKPEIILPDLEISFRDYVLAEKKLSNSLVYEKSKQYWLERLESLPLAPQLPIIKNQNEIKELTFKRLSYSLDENKWNVIKEQALKAGVSKSVILLTIFSKVISLWSKNPSFTLNLTFFNRLPLHKQINQIVGDFTSLTLLEINDQLESLEKSAIKIQNQLWQDIDNRHIGGIWVLRELAKLKGLENASMPVVFTSMLAENESFKDNFIGDITYSITQTPQVWLDHQVTESQGKLTFNWDYPENIFPKTMMEKMFKTYCDILEKISQSDYIWNNDFYISDLIKLDNHNQQDIIPVSNKLLHQLFLDQVKINPQQKAVITENLEFTYQDIAKRVNYLSLEIQKYYDNDSDENKLIAVIMEKGWEQVVATLAILNSGFAYLPINPEHPKDRIDYLLKTCEIKIVITQEKWADNIDIDKNIKVITVKEDISEFYENEIAKTNINTKPEDLAYVIFTSGSTGLPKGVMIDHQGAVNTILDINKRFNITQEDKVLALSSLNFDLSVYDIFGILATGATIVIPDPDASRDPEHWLKIIKRENVTVWNSVPTLMKMLIEYINNKPERKADSLKTVMLSGDWIPLSLPAEIMSLNPNIHLYSLGGATEASIWSIYYPVKEINQNWQSIPYGKALSNQKMYVLNDQLERCPDYVTGQIYIGGIGLAKGYYKDKNKTDSSFITHPKTGEKLYKTGDLGRYYLDGNIEFLGREDSQVKIQGHRIELGELEAVLMQHESIKNAVIKAFSKEGNEKYLVGYIQFRNQSVDDKQIIEFMESKLPCYMVPAIFVHLEKLPISSNGKVDRNALLAPEKRQEKTIENIFNQEYVLKISEMVKKVLDIDYVDSKADLLAMGTNSIDIVKLANLLEEEFGFCPKTGDIFRLKTIDQLAVFYETNKAQIKQIDKSKNDLIFDPYEREVFKNSQNNIRKLNTPSIALAKNEDDQTLFNDYASSRNFSDKEISTNQIANLLAVLRQVNTSNGYKYLYPSAGGLYPVQVYLYLKEKTDILAEGIYYYNPQLHNLFLIAENINLDKNTHFFVNQSIYENSKFSIFLIADLKAIEPIYGNSSLDYCYIESGSISQLLRMNAAKNEIGLCSIGQIDFEKIREIIKLDEKSVLLHTILGGSLSKENVISWSFLETENTDDQEWEEITI